MAAQVEAGRQVCFVDMPFGKKVDVRSGVEIDFDDIYAQAIEPGVRAAPAAF